MKQNFAQRHYTQLETLADMAYVAGHFGFRYPDSRQTAESLIYWMQEFNDLHRHTNWDEVDYVETVDKFTVEKILSELDDIEEQSLYADSPNEYKNVCRNCAEIREKVKAGL